MDRLHLMAVFVAVAEEESFAGAARRLGMSPPSVTRSVASLENWLGVKLLHRTTRHVRVTSVGERYLHDVRQVLCAADEADAAAVGLAGKPSGHLTVTAPVLFGRMYVMPGIVRYLKQYPETSVSALLLDRVVNLLEEGVDVGIRIGDLPDSSIQALRVGQVHRVVCASPSYLQAHGSPVQPQDLKQHSVIVSSGLAQSVEWRFLQHGEAISVRINPRLTVSSNDGAIEAAACGLGIARLMSYQVAPMVATGRLQTVLDEFEAPPVPIHILHREGRHASAKVRAFVDLLADHLRAQAFTTHDGGPGIV